MTAADQPTTEPSKSRDDLVRLAHLTADGFADIDGPHAVHDAWPDSREKFTVADLHALADLAALAPQPAADTEREVKARALREAAFEMDNTDDPDAIHVSNGDIDLWLEARADRIERGEEA